jgi:hypothetical protein
MQRLIGHPSEFLPRARNDRDSRENSHPDEKIARGTEDGWTDDSIFVVGGDHN